MADKKIVLLFALIVLFSAVSIILNIIVIYLLNIVGLYSVSFDPSVVLGSGIAGALIGAATYIQCEL